VRDAGTFHIHVSAVLFPHDRSSLKANVDAQAVPLETSHPRL